MDTEPADRLWIRSLRPVVRYVDEDRAVVETLVTFDRPLPRGGRRARPEMVVYVEVDSDEGFHDEQTLPLQRHGDRGTARFDVVCPQLWWPAGMGEQALYTMTVQLVADGEVLDTRTTTLGLTSVRRMSAGEVRRGRRRDTWLVNGRQCSIQSVVPVDVDDERALLPAAGDSLILVRGHYGPDVLYEAADRAGILLLQAVPIHPEGRPESEMAAEVDRLAGHPSLVGWYVGHLGHLTERMAYCVHSLDPTRTVFRGGDGLLS